MSLARSFAARLLSALLIVATVAAAHQHRLVTPATDALTIDRAQPEATASAEVAHCAVCRALQTAEPVTLTECVAAVVAEAELSTPDAVVPASRITASRSPRAPPARVA